MGRGRLHKMLDFHLRPSTGCSKRIVSRVLLRLTSARDADVVHSSDVKIVGEWLHRG